MNGCSALEIGARNPAPSVWQSPATSSDFSQEESLVKRIEVAGDKVVVLKEVSLRKAAEILDSDRKTVKKHLAAGRLEWRLKGRAALAITLRSVLALRNSYSTSNPYSAAPATLTSPPRRLRASRSGRVFKYVKMPA